MDQLSWDRANGKGASSWGGRKRFVVFVNVSVARADPSARSRVAIMANKDQGDRLVVELGATLGETGTRSDPRR